MLVWTCIPRCEEVSSPRWNRSCRMNSTIALRTLLCIPRLLATVEVKTAARRQGDRQRQPQDRLPDGGGSARRRLGPSAAARSTGGTSTALPGARERRSGRTLYSCRPLLGCAACTRPRTCGAWPWAQLPGQECRLVRHEMSSSDLLCSYIVH